MKLLKATEASTEAPTAPPESEEPAPFITTEVAIILAVAIACIIGIGRLLGTQKTKINTKIPSLFCGE